MCEMCKCGETAKAAAGIALCAPYKVAAMNDAMKIFNPAYSPDSNGKPLLPAIWLINGCGSAMFNEQNYLIAGENSAGLQSL